VTCTDFNAEYDDTLGHCRCSDDYFDTSFGCQKWENAHNAISTAIVDEIVNRLQAIFDGGQYPDFTAHQLGKMQLEFWPTMNFKVGKKAHSVCGRRSRTANTNYYMVMQNLHDDFAHYSSMEQSDLSTVTSLIQLYSSFLKQGIFNCRKSGFGNDPTDGSIDANGVTCTPFNMKETFKCRLQYRYAALFNNIFGTGTLTF
jgi:hypothetical protein